MEYRTLGSSDLSVSAVTMGLWNLTGGRTWPETTSAQAERAIEAAIDAGITSFDTAEDYGDGESERVLGSAIEHRDREALTIATKASADNHDPADLKAACRASLDRLGTSYLDLYYLHWPNEEVPFADTFEALAELRSDGRIREVGVSNFGPEQVAEARAASPVPIVANQVPYNLLWRAIEYDVRDATVTAGASIATYSSLAQGLLTGTYDDPADVPEGIARSRHFDAAREHARHDEAGAEALTFETIDRIRDIAADAGHPLPRLALAWLLHRDGVDTVIAGSTSPDHVRENAAAADLDLDAGTIDRLDAATADLKDALGDNPDLWESDSRFR